MKKIIFLTVFVLWALVGCNNLQWSEVSYPRMTWDEAKQYCEDLDEDDHNDWRLPNIDELRTLIKAPEAISGGKCQISEKAGKLADEDYTRDCSNSICKLGGDSITAGFPDILWSSSVQSDNPDKAWTVDFGDGRVSHTYTDSKQFVSCVR